MVKWFIRSFHHYIVIFKNGPAIASIIQKDNSTFIGVRISFRSYCEYEDKHQSCNNEFTLAKFLAAFDIISTSTIIKNLKMEEQNK